MNILSVETAVQWLFLDLNAFFASCEQQETPALRGKPIPNEVYARIEPLAMPSIHPTKTVGG
jgi:hypothetical protein